MFSCQFARPSEVKFISHAQSTDPYGCDLVVCTEREKFLVPVVATGVMPELDLPGATFCVFLRACVCVCVFVCVCSLKLAFI